MPLNDLEIGAMFWAGRDPVETLRELKSMGVACGQVGVPGDLSLDGAGAAWSQAMAQEGFTLVTVFCAYNGESYADIPTVKDTVGFIPRATRDERVARTLAASDFAAEIGVPSIGAHIGFVPEDTADPDYIAVREVVRRICDHAGKYGQTFALETGQEAAETLLAFFRDVNRANLRINFDPANMILYGTGDPIDALGTLGAHVVSVHCKDGNWPPPEKPGALGEEQPLGQGAVGVERFVNKLKAVGYKGPLCIEREGTNHATWVADVTMAVKLLQSLA